MAAIDKLVKLGAALRRRQDDVSESLGEMNRELRRQTDRMEKIMTKLDDLAAEVAAVKDVATSAVTALSGLHAELVEARASNDPARLDALIADLDATKDTLAKAITDNTTEAAPSEDQAAADQPSSGDVSSN